MDMSTIYYNVLIVFGLYRAPGVVQSCQATEVVVERVAR